MTTEQPFRDAVQPGVTAERYRHTWVIGNLELDEAAGYLTARLGYFPETEQDIEIDYDQDRLAFVERPRARLHGVSGGFAMHYETGAVSFEEHPDIGPTGFISHLAAVMTQTGIGDFRGMLLRNEEDYKSFVERVDKVIRVSFDVRRPNPRDREIFRPLKEDLLEANAERERRVYENDEGLNFPLPSSADVPTDNPLAAGVEMVEEGFGAGDGYHIDAIEQGRPTRYQYSPTRAASDYRDEEEEVSEEFDARKEVLIRWLKERLDWLLARTER